MKFPLTIAVLLSLALNALGTTLGATHYVDSSASGANNGTSWTDAWTTIGAGTGLSAGDTVYISGGSTGSSKTYACSTWTPAAGVTYQIGQVAGHNGLVKLDTGGGEWLVVSYYAQSKNFTVSGAVAGDSGKHIEVLNTGGNQGGINISSPDANQDGLACNITLDHIIITNGCYASPALLVSDYVTNFDFGFCEVRGLSVADDRLIDVGNVGAVHYEFGNYRFHNNMLWVPKNLWDPGVSSEIGDGVSIDCFSMHTWGIDVYSNVLSSYIVPSHQSGAWQHQDFFNGSAHRMRVWANTFINPGSSVEDMSLNEGCFWFNNLTVNTMPHAIKNVGYTVEYNGGTLETGNWYVGNEIVNVIQDTPEYQYNTAYFSFYLPNGENFYSNGIANTLIINSAGAFATTSEIVGFYVPIDTTLLFSNKNYGASFSSSWFSGYVDGNARTVPDMHLTQSGAVEMQTGKNLYDVPALSPYMSFLGWDRDGNPRPTDRPWQLGMYEYTGPVTNPVARLNVSSLGFGTVTNGDRPTQIVWLTNDTTGSNNLIGYCTLSADAGFNVTNGSPFNVPPGVGVPITVQYSPLTISDSAVLGFVGGSNGVVSIPLSGNLYVAPTLLGLSFQATQGVAYGVIGITNGVVTSTSSTNDYMRYWFNVTNAGNYTLSATERMQNGGANSFLISVDSPWPTNTYWVWDGPVNNGWTNVPVSLRGNGTFDTNQFVPWVIPLAKGTHYLNLVSRPGEPGSQVSDFVFTAYSPTTTNTPHVFSIGGRMVRVPQSQ